MEGKAYEIFGDFVRQRNILAVFLLIAIIALALVAGIGYITVLQVYDKPTGFLERLPDGSVRVVRLADQMQIVPSDILNFTREFIDNTVRVDFAILEDQQAAAMTVMSKELKLKYDAGLKESVQIRDVKRAGVRSKVFFNKCKCTDQLQDDAEVREIKPGVWQVTVYGWREAFAVARGNEPLPRWPFVWTGMLQKAPGRNELTKYGLFITAFDLQHTSDSNPVDSGLNLTSPPADSAPREQIPQTTTPPPVGVQVAPPPAPQPVKAP